jgi:protein-S-isoprenylcysteine O-methyltransferase Ste14
VIVGANLQILGLLICVASFISLGRSFGFAAADRGVKQRGTYAVVRHPVYASYIFLLSGYVLQSMSLANVLVVVVVLGCDVGRALSEELLLTKNADYVNYRQKVRWRMIPAVW